MTSRCYKTHGSPDLGEHQNASRRELEFEAQASALFELILQGFSLVEADGDEGMLPIHLEV